MYSDDFYNNEKNQSFSPTRCINEIEINTVAFLKSSFLHILAVGN